MDAKVLFRHVINCCYYLPWASERALALSDCLIVRACSSHELEFSLMVLLESDAGVSRIREGEVNGSIKGFRDGNRADLPIAVRYSMRRCILQPCTQHYNELMLYEPIGLSLKLSS